MGDIGTADEIEERNIRHAEEESRKVIDKQREILQAFRDVDSTDAGKKVIEFLEGYSGYKMPSYIVGSGSDGTYDAIFADGRKDMVALWHHQVNAPLPEERDIQTTAE